MKCIFDTCNAKLKHAKHVYEIYLNLLLLATKISCTIFEVDRFIDNVA